MVEVVVGVVVEVEAEVVVGGGVEIGVVVVVARKNPREGR